jgi:hypothetical protein
VFGTLSRAVRIAEALCGGRAVIDSYSAYESITVHAIGLTIYFAGLFRVSSGGGDHIASNTL